MVVCLIAAGSAVTAIERASQTDVQRVLAVDGHEWVDVTVDGLIVGLGGTAPDEATRFRALTVAGSAVDAARIVDQMTVSTPEPIQPPRFSIEILRNDDGIALIGLIPEATDREALIERATEIAGTGTVTDLMETADFPAAHRLAPRGRLLARGAGAAAALEDLGRRRPGGDHRDDRKRADQAAGRDAAGRACAAGRARLT